MEKTATKKPKKRATKYEQKVKFSGSFNEMIGISIKDAEKKKAAKDKL
ncbi:MAG TPA: hypothetical protein VFG10_20745 [Saprospiraceae bacterium]|nr:hypothetical protein [Saprospiraceae bacterium]